MNWQYKTHRKIYRYFELSSSSVQQFCSSFELLQFLFSWLEGFTFQPLWVISTPLPQAWLFHTLEVLLICLYCILVLLFCLYFIPVFLVSILFLYSLFCPCYVPIVVPLFLFCFYICFQFGTSVLSVLCIGVAFCLCMQQNC